MRIRRALDSEIDEILELDRQCLPGCTWDRDEVDGALWVAEEKGAIVGFASARALQSDPTTCYLDRAGIVSGWRGRGRQRRLIAVREAWAKRQGLAACVTYTVPVNVASSNNLISRGFRLYRPELQWGGADCLYWIKKIPRSP